jgi:predicted nucleic acid-binding protein
MHTVVDTNILIDYLSGIPQAKRELRRYTGITISHMTWMEVMAGAHPGADEQQIRAFLAQYTVQTIDTAIAERAVAVRRAHRIRLPDAIIWATAQQLGLLFVTRNTKDFPANDPAVRIPYKV